MSLPPRARRLTLPWLVAWSCFAVYLVAAHGVGSFFPLSDPHPTDPHERPTLPWPQAIALACVMLFAWAVAPWGWRGH